MDPALTAATLSWSQWIDTGAKFFYIDTSPLNTHPTALSGSADELPTKFTLL